MAIIKCKMCGGDIEISADKTFGTCEYCGTQQTVPKQDNEKKLTLFARANRLRFACEFDKAAGVYESIVAEFPEEAEAYWGLVLCKYGIEYVDDPATGKKIPTCHRSSFDSVLEDANFELVMEYADVVTRKLYREEAKAIEELRRDIIEVSSREEPYDIFICYKETDENGQRTLDSVLAQDLYDALTEKGYRVFFSRITLEDKLGQEYEPYIFAALNSARVMLAVGTDYEYFNAPWVRNEWSRYLQLIAAGQKKSLIPCYKNIDAYDMPKEFAKLQAQDLGKVGATQDLLRGIDKLLGKTNAPAVPAQPAPMQPAAAPNVDSLLRRGTLFLEDSDWTNANAYFDKVLDIAPECGAAYLGKFLARVQCRSAKAYADAYIKNVKTGAPKEKNADACDVDEAFISSCVEKYAVPGILSENKIRQALEFDLRYCVTSDYYELRAEEAQTQFSEDKDLIRAAKYASSEAKTIQDSIQNALNSLRADAQKREDAEKTKITAEYRKFLTETEARLEKEHPQQLKEAEEAKKAEIYRRRKAKAAAKKAGILVAIVAGIVTAAVLFTVNVILPPVNYSKAEKLLAAGDVKKAAISFGKCTGYQDARERSMALWDTTAVRETLATNWMGTAALKTDGTVTAVGSDEYIQEVISNWTNIVAISKGWGHTVGLEADGTVLAVGGDPDGECGVSDWTDIVAISAGDRYTVGLKVDGTVVAVGDDGWGKSDVSRWTNIVAISAGYNHTVSLKADGTVVAVGYNRGGQCDVSGWTDIVAISTGYYHTVGLKADGTVVAVGNNDDGQCDVSDWTDIVAISAGVSHTVGLKADGTVVAVGDNEYGQCDVSDWTDIVAISVDDHTVGLKKDGTVVAVGENEYGQCDVSGWSNIKLPN